MVTGLYKEENLLIAGRTFPDLYRSAALISLAIITEGNCIADGDLLFHVADEILVVFYLPSVDSNDDVSTDQEAPVADTQLPPTAANSGFIRRPAVKHLYNQEPAFDGYFLVCLFKELYQTGG